MTGKQWIDDNGEYWAEDTAEPQTNVSRETERRDSVVKLFAVAIAFFAAFIVAFFVFAVPAARAQSVQAYLIICYACGNNDRPLTVIPWGLGIGSCMAAALNITRDGEQADDGSWARCTPDDRDLEEASARQIETICYNRKRNPGLRLIEDGEWTVERCIASMTPPRDEE